MSEFIQNPDETKELLPRFRIFYVALTLAVIIFSIRLWYLQVLQGAELREFSEKNRIKQIKVAAPRGLMLDREGRILVENRPGFEAILSPQYIENLESVAAVVAPILGTEPEKVVQRVQRSRRQNGPYAAVRLKENLSRDEVFRLKRIRLDTPGLEIREAVMRSYPLRDNGAQLFGYVSEISKKQIPLYNELYKGVQFEQGDIVGKFGIEEILERDIRGENGYQYVQVDAFGRETVTQTPNVYGEQIKDRESIAGANVILTIDRDIQEAAWKTFSGEGRIGGVVAMKANGEVLAWISTPSFDPNDFAAGISAPVWSKLINDPFKPLRNKVIQDYFAPGSTFKALMAVAALQEKVITPTTLINCPGSLRFGNRDYHDHLRGGHGTITVFEALERSSNVFFYKMGISLGIEKMYNYIFPMGIGSKTGVELPREAAGLMPNSAWKRQAMGEEWQPGENLSNAIGQGFVQATPIQLAVSYLAIGTEGKVVRPFLIKKVADLEGKVLRETQPQVLRDLQEHQSTGVHIDAATFKTVKEGLRRVVQGSRGTARQIRIPGFEIAGKTGTAQVRGFAANDIYSKCENRPINQRHHGWFVGFAPADNPEIVVAALAEHSCHGSSGAGPVVHAIMNAYFSKHYPEKMAEAAKQQKGAPAAPAPAPVEGE
ncbi:MAG: penicillin-binding protein 2 [Bdellovibrionaceae bacterium]|nr:penicillin-binding protein 2 [Pseudobdellovibrionaceae bacterium]